MNRDSKLWWLGMIGAIVLGISAHEDVLTPLLPAAYAAQVHSLLELTALLIGIVSGKMATSPLPSDGK